MAMIAIETGKNFKVFTDGKDGPKLILLQKVRLSFPAVGHKKSDENEDGTTSESYKAAPMLPKETHEDAKKKVTEIIKELIAENDAKVPTDKWFIKNGDESEREEYQGHWVISCSDKTRRPIARDEDGELMYVDANYEGKDEREDALNAIDEKFFPGCIVDILIRPWYFGGKVKGKTKTFPKRVCAGFAAIKFVKDDGVKFSKGSIDDSSVWDDDGGSKPSKKSKVQDDDDDL